MRHPCQFADLAVAATVNADQKYTPIRRREPQQQANVRFNAADLAVARINWMDETKTMDSCRIVAMVRLNAVHIVRRPFCPVFCELAGTRDSVGNRFDMPMTEPRLILVNHLMEPPGRVTGITRFLFALLSELVSRPHFPLCIGDDMACRRSAAITTTPRVASGEDYKGSIAAAGI